MREENPFRVDTNSSQVVSAREVPFLQGRINNRLLTENKWFSLHSYLLGEGSEYEKV
jgi:hypothetical protein